MNHLKHSKFISKEDELTFSYMKYIDDNYSNDLRDIEDEYRYSIGGQEQWIEFEKKSIKQIKLTRKKLYVIKAMFC